MRRTLLVMILTATLGGCAYQYKEPPPELPPPKLSALEIQGRVNSIVSRTWTLMDVSMQLPDKLKARNSPYADRAAAWRDRCSRLHMKAMTYSISREVNILPDFNDPLNGAKRTNINRRDIDTEVEKHLEEWDAERKAVEQEFRELVNLLADSHGST